MADKIEFEQLNHEWNAEPNAPEVRISVLDNAVVVQFFLAAFPDEPFGSDDEAKLIFHNCLQYRYGSPNDEGFYVLGQSRYKSFGVKWGEFYLVHHSNWEEAFPNSVFVSNQPHDTMNHYLFYFRDGAFECVAKSFEMQLEPN